MRIAVLADIHGNRHALEAVLADLPRHAPDLVVNLGDCLSGPLDSAGTADLLMAQNWLTLRGNHDRQVLEGPIEAMGKSDAATARQLTPSHRAWLAALPSTLMPVEGILACHGTPGDDLTYLLETVTPPGRIAPATPADITARLGETPGGGLVLCAHSHLPRLRRAADGRRAMNPGSLGLPAYRDEEPWPHDVEAGSPEARYALLDRRGSDWAVTFLAIPYDHHAAAAVALAAGRPDWAHALATGHMPPHRD